MIRLRHFRWEPRLALALAAALVYHGGLLVSGTFRRTYDAYVHIFFADHYARSWFDPWEPRWYTGFTVTSYPPGGHQLVALLSHLVGLEAAFVIVQTAAILLLVAGVYRYAQLWVSPRAAGYAAVLAVMATGVAETVHVFGQLPTTLALGLLLNAAPSVHRWVSSGGGRHLLQALAMLAATTAAHHVTTLFGAVFFIGPVIAAAVVAAWRTPVTGEPVGRTGRVTRTTFRPLAVRRLRRVLPGLGRAAVLMAGTAVALALVVLPYWLWSRSDPITQIPIPHASRESFLVDLNAGLVFFVVPWGLLLPLLPVLVWRGLRSAAWPYTASLAFMFLLGTGGTTPIPRLLLGGAFEILTLDRFTFWASILALPLAGQLLQDLLRRRSPRRTALVAAGAVGALAVSVLVANLAQLRTFQPDPIDPGPIVAFLEKDQHDRWRYLTLGFGDQMAWLSAQTTAQTVDGNYHSARRLPELVTTPVERLEGAKFRGVPGLGSLQQFLTIPERYHLKYVFSNDTFYDPLLSFSGWHRLRRLENGIVVWEREDVPPLPGEATRPAFPLYQRLMWGTLPLTALAGAATVMAATTLPALRPARRRRFAWYRPIDRWLEANSHVPPDAVAPRDWHVWRRPLARLSARAGALRFVRSAAGAAVLLAAGTFWIGMGTGSDPANTVVAYFEDLDFRRFREAWLRLDEGTRPAYDAYLLQLSVEDGLLASYAMLDSVEAGVVSNTGSTAVVDVDLRYVTALAEYRRQDTMTLHRSGRTWQIVPDPTDPTIPAEQFFRRIAVEYGAQQRRRVTTGTTGYADVLDRPEISIRSARVVEADGRLVVVGELVNTDVDPADLTVAAQLRTTGGSVVAAYNAGTAIAHKLGPFETTPFRIDFQGIAGAVRPDDPAAGSFRPDAFTPPTLDAGVTAADVFAKAVVTGTDLDRPLVAQHLRVTGSAALTLSGELLNLGTVPVTVPHLLVTMYGADGSVAWVDEFHLADAIRPGRANAFSLELTPASAVTAVDVPTTLFDNSLSGTVTDHMAPTDVIPLPAAAGYSGLRVTVTGFMAEGS